MNCTRHIRNPVSVICIAPHKCQYSRKLCGECQDDHQVDQKYIVSVKKFKEIVIKKQEDFKLDKTFDITEQKNNIQYILSQMVNAMKKIEQELIQSIKQIFYMIELEDKSVLQILNNDTDPTELANGELDMLVQIVEGEKKQDWTTQKKFYIRLFEQIKNLWGQEIKAFNEKIKKELKEIMSQEFKPHTRTQPTIEIVQVQESKQDLHQILASLADFDMKIFSSILEIFKREKIIDILKFFSKDPQNIIDQYFIKYNQLNVRESNINYVANIIKNINVDDFNTNNYSTEDYNQTRKEQINKISGDKKMIKFLKFLVRLTAINEKFIQCGSNSLNLLIEMKANLTNNCFENIRIFNTSIIGANFVRCNLSGSIFNNVDISGINLNAAILLNCKWSNIKIDESSTLEGHTDIVRAVSISSNGKLLASGGYDKSIRLWIIKTGQQKAKLDVQAEVNQVCFSPNCAQIAFSCDNSICLWDIKTGKLDSKFQGHSSWVRSIVFSPDGTLLASGSDDNSIRLWNVKTEQQKAQMDGHNNWVLSVSFSPDGALLASGSRDKSIRIWNVKTGQQKNKLDGHNKWVQSVCFSPEGKLVASGGKDKSIYLWDVETGEKIAEFIGHIDCVNSICFSFDGTQLASGSRDKSIRIWNVKTGQQQAKLDGHTSYVLSVCFSPDGASLASGSHDKSIRLWDIKTQKKKAKFNECIQSVNFSPDSATLATINDDQSIRLWNIQTGREIEPLDECYKNILPQFNSLLSQNNNPTPKDSNYQIKFSSIITILHIAQQATLKAQGAVILKGEFLNHSGNDLRTLFQQRGCFFLESLLNGSEKQFLQK